MSSPSAARGIPLTLVTRDSAKSFRDKLAMLCLALENNKGPKIDQRLDL